MEGKTDYDQFRGVILTSLFVSCYIEKNFPQALLVFLYLFVTFCRVRHFLVLRIGLNQPLRAPASKIVIIHQTDPGAADRRNETIAPNEKPTEINV